MKRALMAQIEALGHQLHAMQQLVMAMPEGDVIESGAARCPKCGGSDLAAASEGWVVCGSTVPGTDQVCGHNFQGAL